MPGACHDKSSEDEPQMTRKPNTQNRAPLMHLSSQPALKVRLAASSKRDENEWMWVVNVAPAAAAVWAERTCEVAVSSVLAHDFKSKWPGASLCVGVGRVSSGLPRGLLKKITSRPIPVLSKSCSWHQHEHKNTDHLGAAFTTTPSHPRPACCFRQGAP